MATTSTDRVRALRERRRRALEAEDAAQVALRPADDLLTPAIEATIDALDLDDQHGAAAQLARQYARTIDRAKDQAWAARWIGPLLLDALEQLGATPAAKARLSKTGRTPARTPGPNTIQRLRSEHQTARTKRGQFG